MANDWRSETVEKLQQSGALLVEDGNHGEYRPRPDEFSDEGTAFIRAADMDGGRVLFQTASKINEVARLRIRKGIGAPGDVLLSHKGTVGKVALVEGDAPPFVCSPQTTFWRTLDTEKLDRRYLFSYMRSPAFQAQLASRAAETDMAPYVSLTSQRGLSVLLPPIHEQREIGRTLGALDDKIELNRRMSETLEAIARALFKSWFVNFDPIRARMEGHTLIASSKILSLFPNSLDDNGVPLQWHQVKLLDVCELKRGYDLPSTKRSAGPFPVISSSGASGRHSKAMVEGPGVVTGRYGTIGQVFFVLGKFWPLNTALYVRDFKGNSPRFVYYLLKQIDFLKYSDKAAVPGINRNHLHEAVVILPPRPLQEEFARLLAPVWARQATTDAQTLTLATIRDALLPKLISSELRVKDAETFLGRVL